MGKAPSHPSYALGVMGMPDFTAYMGQWLAEGKIHYREHLVEGLENAPQAFIGLLEGKNFGKLVVQTNAAL